MVTCVDCCWYDVDVRYSPCGFCTGALGARLLYVPPICRIESWIGDPKNELPF